MTVRPGASPEAQGTAALGAATQEPSAAFTPGPWSLAPATCYLGDEPVPHGWTGLSGGNWFDFALVCTRMADDVFDHPQGVANARLIAAAPELYEALRKIISNTLPGSYAEQTALAALAKAEGKP